MQCKTILIHGHKKYAHPIYDAIRLTREYGSTNRLGLTAYRRPALLEFKV